MAIDWKLLFSIVVLLSPVVIFIFVIYITSGWRKSNSNHKENVLIDAIIKEENDRVQEQWEWMNYVKNVYNLHSDQQNELDARIIHKLKISINNLSAERENLEKEDLDVSPPALDIVKCYLMDDGETIRTEEGELLKLIKPEDNK